MFWFAIIIFILMLLLASLRALIGFRMIRAVDGPREGQRGAPILFNSLIDVLVSLIGLAAVGTGVFPPVETLVATWVMLIFMRLATRSAEKRSS